MIIVLNYQNFVNGRFVSPSNVQTLMVDNPATEEVIATVELADRELVMQAVNAAKQAQHDWRALSAIERAEYLRDLAQQIQDNAEKIGQVLALESGKSFDDAYGEVKYSAEITRYHAEWARRIEGEIIPSDNRRENLLLMHEPLGVVAGLIPFNYPIYTLMRKMAPALITGNSVVIRLSNHTPCSALILAEVIQAVLPAGLVNILVMTHEVAQVLCTHPAIAMITLTGSVNAGQQVLEYCKVNIAKPSLELGGKTPCIIAEDVDFDTITDEVVASKTTHCGQLCTAIERVYVHHSVYELVRDLLKRKLSACSYGNRQEMPTHMGPLISQEAQLKVHQKVQAAIVAGAQLECGGYLPSEKGYFYPPTLLSHCQQMMEIIQEETFAPVLCIMPYQTFTEAIALANQHQYGLASVVYTQRYADIMLAANTIEAGELYINRTPADPYQGYHAGWKRSGLGGDDGKHGMLEFTQTRLVVMPY